MMQRKHRTRLGHVMTGYVIMGQIAGYRFYEHGTNDRRPWLMQKPNGHIIVSPWKRVPPRNELDRYNETKSMQPKRR